MFRENCLILFAMRKMSPSLIKWRDIHYISILDLLMQMKGMGDPGSTRLTYIRSCRMQAGVIGGLYRTSRALIILVNTYAPAMLLDTAIKPRSKYWSPLVLNHILLSLAIAMEMNCHRGEALNLSFPIYAHCHGSAKSSHLHHFFSRKMNKSLE